MTWPNYATFSFIMVRMKLSGKKHKVDQDNGTVFTCYFEMWYSFSQSNLFNDVYLKIHYCKIYAVIYCYHKIYGYQEIWFLLNKQKLIKWTIPLF
jgi:hypothetical protein